MNNVIRTITNTILRNSVNKGMRKTGVVGTVVLAVGAAAVSIATQR